MDFESDIISAVEVMKKGGLILYPTDTIWGIGCDATDSSAVRKVYELKKRLSEKAMVVLVAEEKDILRHVASPDLALFDYLKTLTRPTTVVYDGAIGLADNLIGEDASVAIRICKDPFCRALLKRYRKPIVSTSANLSGEKAPANFSEICDEIKDGVDYIVQYRQDEHLQSQPSQLIKWEKGKVTILRQ